MAAQAAPPQNSEPKHPLDVAFTYDATLSDLATGKDFWVQGGSVRAAGELYRGMSAVADLGGEFTRPISTPRAWT
jgi:hypothetical protein